MLFNSYEFVVFLPIVLLLFFKLPYIVRPLFLLIASYIFYMWWRPEYIVLLLIQTFIDYMAGIYIADSRSARSRRLFLALSMASNLGILFFYKYFMFFNETGRAVLEALHVQYPIPQLEIILPMGISFYTFQSMSYTIDVYRGSTKVERSFLTFSLFVTFFPQLVAGPIERSSSLLSQIHERQVFDVQRFVYGMRHILWGLFKKIVIADRLAVVVQTAYENPSQHKGLPLLLATYCFAIQIYCDFSGYSDIAVGSAQVMGFRLMTNFWKPYHAQSIGDFWQRWHISLSTWFRDYVYIPLGGNRVSRFRHYANLFVTFLISGLWHGANWTFVVWGALHGLYMICSLATKSWRNVLCNKTGLGRWPRAIVLFRIFATFHLVCFGWIFFRAQSVKEAWYITTHLFSDWDWSRLLKLGLSESELGIAFSSILVLETVHLWEKDRPFKERLDDVPVILRWAIYLGLIMTILNFGTVTEIPFIYFQF